MPAFPQAPALSASQASNLIRQAAPSTALFMGLAALQMGISNLNTPGKVTMVGIATDSLMCTQASDINTTAITRLRTKYQDTRNAAIGGSAKSGRGRFGPFHHNGTGAVTGTAGPIIIGGSSGWVRGTSYFTSMFWEDLNHPGSVTPGAGTAYAGCYMAFSQSGLTGNAARWLGLLFNSSLTGVFKVQLRQGASVVSSGSSGTNRYTIVGGVPDPAVGGGDIKLDLTIDPTTTSYPDMLTWITGHINSTTMDPTTIWQVCIYRTTNAATSVSIQGFDAHYDEYSAQNTPSSYGATVLMDMVRPGKSSQIFQGGNSIFGTNADYESQGVQGLHISTHARSYNKSSKFPHSMPTLELIVTNFWRNDVLLVDAIASMTPAIFAQRLQLAALACAKVGVALCQVLDFGASAAYTCAFPYFDQTTQRAQDYTDYAMQAAVNTAALQSTSGVNGGLCCVRMDLAAGTGGPQSYARRSFFSTSDLLHLNDAGQEWEADFYYRLLTDPESIQPYATTGTTVSYEPRSLTSRLGISKTTVLELDPHKYGSNRLSAGDGYYPCKLQHTDYGVLLHGIGAVPYDGTGISTYKLGQTKSGGATTIIYNMDQFGLRAGLEFDNTAASATAIQFDLSSLWTGAIASGITSGTIFFITQNMRQSDLTAALNNQQHYWMFGTTSDKAANPTSIYDALSTSRIMCAAVQGVNSGQMLVRMGDKIPFVESLATNASPAPGREPVLGCFTFDCATGIVRTLMNPAELAATGWKSQTMTGGQYPAIWKPDWLCIGGLLGTGATKAPAAFGGMWLIQGVVTDAEYQQIWNQIYAESGGFFQSGTSVGTLGQGGAINV